MESKMNNTILAVIELDRFPKEVSSRAAWIAKQYGCDLELVLSDPTLGVLRDSYMVSNESKQLADGIREAQEIVLKELAESVADDSLTVTTSISHERPAGDAIIAIALDREPLFVVKGTAYHSPAERATFTYTDWRLIRKLTAPLWLVKPRVWNKTPVIIAAVDPTHRKDKYHAIDQLIVDAAKSFASKCGGTLKLLHTYERLVEIGSHAMMSIKPVRLPVEELDQQIRIEHRQKLDTLASENEIPADEVHQLPGRTRDILPAFARAYKADLVVMGALARTKLKRRILGSTAEQVLDHLPCDILIVRPA
jgi:universal stress protein E